MSFMENWLNGHYGEVQGKAPNAYQPPTIEVYRKRFSEGARGAATKLQRGDEPEAMGWYVRHGLAGYVITLRMGVKAIDCGGGRTRTAFDDLESAVAFLEAAATAALAGELDDLLNGARPKKHIKS